MSSPDWHLNFQLFQRRLKYPDGKFKALERTRISK